MTIKKIYIYGSLILKTILALPFALILKINKKMRNIWIISERGDDARDNGYFFYKYVKENHPNEKIYYIIDKNSADFKKFNKEDRVIQYRSFKHYVYLWVSKYKISTHVLGFTPDKDRFIKLQKLGLVKGKIIFLQHGITKDYHPAFEFPKLKVNLFICGAYPEYLYIRNNFNHPKGVVKYTGLPRFDYLKDESNGNQILIMPTWRKWIRNNALNDRNLFDTWNSLLNNSYLVNLIEKNDVIIIFYPHYEMQKYLSLFKTSSKNVIIASFDSYDVQDLLKKSDLLITDYSSVFFDFAYLNKPVIYYQFDRDKFFKSHYQPGYFDYIKHGFGNVCINEKDVINEIEDYINNEFKLKEKYKKRIDKFFVNKDRNNSLRVYANIKRLK